MSNDKMKIREVLKQVYELYNENEVFDFIFTTFNYETDFFDEQIITYLMGFDRKLSTIGELQAADKWIGDNHVSVYCDKNAISVGLSCLTVPVFPQNMKTGGVFHPKVIVLYGKLKETNKEAVHLIVSSCNLTYMGYGRNMEAFACVEVNSKQVAESLSTFLDSLDSHSSLNHVSLQQYLKTITAEKDGIEFLWTNGDKGISLLDYLTNCPSGDLTVVSPYFDEKGPKLLLDKLSNKSSTTIVPAIDGKTYNICKKDYIDLKDNSLCFFNEISTDNRFVHAKIIKLGKKIIVGSYNFTSAAIKNRLNAEAALVINNQEKYDFNLIPISEEKFIENEKDIKNRDEIKSENENLFISVFADWTEAKISVFVDGLKPDSKYSIRLDGLQDNLFNALSEKQEMQMTYEISRHLLRHKSYSVYNKDGIICMRGLVYELDTNQSRPKLGCESLNESIREWFNEKEIDENDSKSKLRPIYDEDEEIDKILKVSDKTADIFDNYFMVSKSFENLLKQIENNVKLLKEGDSKAQQELVADLITKPGSVENLVNFLLKEHKEDKENQKKDKVYEWLVTRYLQEIIKLFPEEISLDKDKIRYRDKRKELNDIIENFKNTEISKFISDKVGTKYLEWIEKEF